MLGQLLVFALSFALPSDAAKTTAHERIELLRAVCGNNAQAEGCRACPAGTDFAADRLEIASVFYGHFLGPRSDNAAVAFRGCESHANGLGGAFLLSHDNGTWKQVQFRPAWITAGPCKKITAHDGRDLLLCEGSDSHQGVADTYLSLLDFTSEADDNQIPIFFGLDDSGCNPVGNLPPATVITGTIETVAITPALVTVTAKLGTAVLTDAQLNTCNLSIGNGADVLLAKWVHATQRTYRFIFNGATLTPDPANPPTRAAWALPPPR